MHDFHLPSGSIHGPHSRTIDRSKDTVIGQENEGSVPAVGVRSWATLKKECFLSSLWPKLWPVGRPQNVFFS